MLEKSKDMHLIRECLNKLWYPCTIKHDTAVTKKKKKKKKKRQCYTWMNLENITFHERKSVTKKHTVV